MTTIKPFVVVGQRKSTGSRAPYLPLRDVAGLEPHLIAITRAFIDHGLTKADCHATDEQVLKSVAQVSVDHPEQCGHPVVAHLLAEVRASGLGGVTDAMALQIGSIEAQRVLHLARRVLDAFRQTAAGK